MLGRRRLSGIAAWTLGIAIIGAASTRATADMSSQPAFCTGSGAIPVTEIKGPVDLNACRIVGRLLVQPNGRGGVTVPVNDSGSGSALLTTNGEYVLIAEDSDNILTVSASFAPTQTSATSSGETTALSGGGANQYNGGATQDHAVLAAFARPTTPEARPSYAPETLVVPDLAAACSENYWAYTGPRWFDTDYWYYTESTASRAGLTVADTLSDLKHGNWNMTLGKNDCGYTGYFQAYGTFSGDTSLYANIDSNGNTTARWPDGQSTVSWGPLYNNDLAVTAWNYHYGDVMTETDIYFGSNQSIVDYLPADCGNYVDYWDLQSIATHEWGHAYGMAHETSGRWETMYPTANPCATFERTLGEGDWNGMKNLYGMR